MKWLCLFSATCLLFSGCGKKSEQVSETKTVLPPPAQATPATRAAVTPDTQQPLAGKVDPRMTAALRKFVQDKGRMPQSILELAGAELDGVPNAPQGYIYVIDPATKEVKLAKP